MEKPVLETTKIDYSLIMSFWRHAFPCVALSLVWTQPKSLQIGILCPIAMRLLYSWGRHIIDLDNTRGSRLGREETISLQSEMDSRGNIIHFPDFQNSYFSVKSSRALRELHFLLLGDHDTTQPRLTPFLLCLVSYKTLAAWILSNMLHQFFLPKKKNFDMIWCIMSCISLYCQG